MSSVNPDQGQSQDAEHRVSNCENRDADLSTADKGGQLIPDVIPRLRDRLATHDATLSVGRYCHGFVDVRIDYGDYETDCAELIRAAIRHAYQATILTAGSR